GANLPKSQAALPPDEQDFRHFTGKPAPGRIVEPDGPAGLHRRDLWSDRRLDDAEIDPGALQPGGGWRAAPGRVDRRLRAPAENGRSIPNRAGGIDQKVFAPTGPRRNLEQFCAIALLSPER